MPATNPEMTLTVHNVESEGPSPSPFGSDISTVVGSPPNPVKLKSEPWRLPDYFEDPFNPGPEGKVVLSGLPSTQKRRGSSRNASSSSTFLPGLSSLHRTLSRNALGDVTLGEILSGATCSPLGFKDFEQFLTHTEISVENLLFVVWFRTYHKKFYELPLHEQQKAPRPNLKPADSWSSPEGYEKLGLRAPDVLALGVASMNTLPKSRIDGEIGINGDITLIGKGDLKSCQWDNNATVCSYTGLDEPINCSTESNPLGKTISNSSGFTKFEDILAQQPLREDCRRAWATFLRRGAGRELNLEDNVRERTRLSLHTSTHPDVFMPVYGATLHLLESHSLPHFLSYASTNINVPKQLFWTAIGLIDLAISLVLLIVMIYCLPDHHFRYRLARIPSALFACFGSMQLYSASVGFCTQVWGRKARQMHPWELEDLELDEEANIGGASETSDNDLHLVEGTPRSQLKHLPTLTEDNGEGSDQPTLFTDPFTSSKEGPPQLPHLDVGTNFSNMIRRISIVSRHSFKGAIIKVKRKKILKRPPIFGPEVVIEDPRVIAIHSKVVKHILLVGGAWFIIWLALCFAVPGVER